MRSPRPPRRRRRARRLVLAVPSNGAGRPRRGAAPGLSRRPAADAPGNRPRPSAGELAAAVERHATVPDVIGPDLDVLFCGVNPGRWSGAVGHHFAHPGNRFWKALHLAGFTDRQLAPAEEGRLVDCGIGITNLVERTTAAAADLDRAELRQGLAALERKVRRFGPRTVAFLGMGAFRVAFERPKAQAGRQSEMIGRAVVWVVPNPSGLQAAYGLDDVVAQLRVLRSWVRGGSG